MWWHLSMLLAGCGGITPVGPPDLAPSRDSEVLGIGLAPRNPTTAVGQSVPFFATAYFDDATFEDISDSVVWHSSDVRVATLSRDGVAFAQAQGETIITATDSRGAANQVTLRVVGGDVELVRIEVQPIASSLYIGDATQLAAVAHYGDGSSGTLGSGCVWGAVNGAIASVDASAQVVGQAEGMTQILVDCEGFQGASSVEVVDASVDLGVPDLRVSSLSVVAVGNEVVWEAEVENVGEAHCPGFFVDAILDGGGGPAQTGIGDASTLVTGLAPGSTAQVSLGMAAAPAGSYNTYLVLDWGNLVHELDEGNNQGGPVPVTVEDTSGLADLSLQAASASVGVKQTSFTIEVVNEGDEVAESFWIDLYRDHNDDPGLCELGDHFVQVTALFPGESFVWSPIEPSAPGFEWTSHVSVDTCDNVAESDEENNQGSFSVTP